MRCCALRITRAGAGSIWKKRTSRSRSGSLVPRGGWVTARGGIYSDYLSKSAGRIENPPYEFGGADRLAHEKSLGGVASVRRQLVQDFLTLNALCDDVQSQIMPQVYG